MYRSSSSSLGISLLLVLLLVCCSSWRVVDGFGRMVGGRTEIKDVKSNQEVQELGKFSVEEYNKKQHQHSQYQGGSSGGGGGGVDLVFSKVVEAERQVVSGIKYFLKIAASQNGVAKSFDAVVVVKPWNESKQLLTFAPSTN